MKAFLKFSVGCLLLTVLTIVYSIGFKKLKNIKNIQSSLTQIGYIQNLPSKSFHQPAFSPWKLKAESSTPVFGYHQLELPTESEIHFSKGELIFKTTEPSVLTTKIINDVKVLQINGSAIFKTTHRFNDQIEIQINSYNKLTLTSGYNYFEYRKESNSKVSLSLIKGQIRFENIVFDENTYALFDKNLDTKTPLVARLDQLERSPLDYFSDLRHKKKTPLSQIELQEPLRDSKIRIPSSSIKKTAQLRFHWEEIPGSISYDFELSKDKDFRDLVIKKTIKNTYVLLNDIKKGIYYWRVRPQINSNYFSHYSETRRIEISE